MSSRIPPMTLSPMHLQINCRKMWNKIYHFASNALPHYLAKLDTVCSDSVSLLTTTSATSEIRNSVSYVYTVLCYSITTCVWRVAACCCCAKNVAMMLNVVSHTQKKISKLKLNLSNMI